MTEIFISYRRKSSAFTLLLANKLSEQLEANIFVDIESIDEADFENSILKHLHQSDVFLLMVTEHTFAERIHRDTDWVRKEIRVALERNIPIILVCENGLLPPTDLPDDIRAVCSKQGIEFYPVYFDAAVARLVKFISKVAQIQRKTTPTVVENLPVPAEEIEQLEITQSEINTDNARQILSNAIDAYDSNDFAKALFLFEALQDIGYSSRMFDIPKMIDEINQHYARQERKRKAAYDYEEIRLFARGEQTREHALVTFQQWAQENTEFVIKLDTEGLRLHQQDSPELSKPQSRPPSSTDLMPPPFDWIEIPGNVHNIAKYPVTNAQFAKFIEAGGYDEPRWWTDAGWMELEDNDWTEPLYWNDSRWNGAEQPVVGVSWYEAVAFCLWLSEATGEQIMLPTEDQWQRAAQGHDGRAYPWGHKWNSNRCNNSVDVISDKTTPVTQYEASGNRTKGNSASGMVDMAGNVWEWCLTGYDDRENDIIRTCDRVRRGGSWFDKDPNLFRCDSRFGDKPDLRTDGWGFRLARLNPIPNIRF